MSKLFLATLAIVVAMLSTEPLCAQARIGTINFNGKDYAIIGFQTSATSTVGNTTASGGGMNSGRRQHLPFEITRVVDASSQDFQQAFVKSERLDITITIARPQSATPLMTIKLTNGTITKLTMLDGASGNRDQPGYQFLEEISFSYQNIEYTYTDGKTTVKDTWTQQ